MQSLRIWAPHASRVELQLDGRSITAARESAGWWRGPALSPGARYAISVDGGPPRPDPRSPWQPDGVHGASCWIDPSQLQPGERGQAPRVTPVPLCDALIYELLMLSIISIGLVGFVLDRLMSLLEARFKTA